MFRFISKKNNEVLCQDYLALFNIAKLNSDFSKFLKSHPEVNQIMPRGMRKASAILVAPFTTLVKIYFKYLQHISSLTPKDANIEKALLAKIFNYSSHTSGIASFLINPYNGFEIHNCVYCDLTKINGYKRKKNGQHRREFQTEHVLDKGQCPIVGLSLFNFVPSCGTCNAADLKGTKSLGRTETEMLVLSPTSVKNRFDEEVSFTFSALNGVVEDLRIIDNIDGLEIDFKGNTKTYERTISLFELKDRYNDHKEELLENILIGREYPMETIEKIANDMGRSAKDVFESIFKFKARKNRYEPMEKCQRELYKEAFGEIPFGL